MYSTFSTPKKKYLLKTAKYICNKFGLSEFFAANYEKLSLSDKSFVLDVGCGAFPLGIFLADQYDDNVVGVEFNSEACNCAQKNIDSLNLASKACVVANDFSNYSISYDGPKFDFLIAVPPIDDSVSDELIKKYAGNKFIELTDESYSYLTNSWHSADGKDLVDYMFSFSKENLKNDGCVVIIFCDADCHSTNYVIEKACKNGFRAVSVFYGEITGESVGIKRHIKSNFLAYIIKFVKEHD